MNFNDLYKNYQITEPFVQVESKKIFFVLCYFVFSSFSLVTFSMISSTITFPLMHLFSTLLACFFIYHKLLQLSNTKVGEVIHSSLDMEEEKRKCQEKEQQERRESELEYQRKRSEENQRKMQRVKEEICKRDSVKLSKNPSIMKEDVIEDPGYSEESTLYFSPNSGLSPDMIKTHYADDEEEEQIVMSKIHTEMFKENKKYEEVRHPLEIDEKKENNNI